MTEAPGAHFFPPWEAAPAYVGQPHDQALEQRISKLAEFAAKNGPPFVDVIRQKQLNNPEYAFLSGGHGADYFRWRLYTSLNHLDPVQPAPGQTATHQAQPGSDPTSVLQEQDPRPVLQQAAGNLPANVYQGFGDVLSKLNGTRSSIKDSKEWFMACIQHAEGLAAQMALHQQQLPAYEQQLHIIFLANDVLLKSLLQRKEGGGAESDPVARAFQTALPVMLHSAFQTGNASPEVAQRLTTILDHWEGRGVYSQQYVAELKRAIYEGPAVQHTQPANQQGAHQQSEGYRPPRGAPPLQPWQQHAPPQQHAPLQQPILGGFNTPQEPFRPPPQGQWETGAARPASFFPQEAYAFPPPQPGFGMGGMQPGFPASMQPGGFAGLPPRGPPPPGPVLPPAQQPLVLPAWNGPGQVQGALPPQAAQGPPPDVTIAGNPAVADQPPVDPMSFPPGLLPALVEENLRTEEPYAPLSKRDIDKAGIPRATEPDSYLLARLDRFYAELKDYRSGTSKADLEDERRRQRSVSALGGAGVQALPPTAASRSGQQASDGSFRGASAEGGPTGLGFSSGASADNNLDDPFCQYRKKRSGFYHEAITRATAAANEQQPPVR